MLKLFKKFATVSIMLLASSFAHADIIHWAIDGGFDDNGGVHGGFDFNTTSNAFSNVTLYTTIAEEFGGGIFGDYSHAGAVFFPGENDHFVFYKTDYVNSEFLQYILYNLEFRFDPSQPGYTAIDNGKAAESVLYDAYTEAHHSDRLSVIGAALGTLAPPVPEPETYAMILAGLGMMGFAIKRRGKLVPKANSKQNPLRSGACC